MSFTHEIIVPELHLHIFVYLRHHHNLVSSVDKCQLCGPELRYLGYVVNQCGLHVGSEMVKVILEYSQSTVDSRCTAFRWYRRASVLDCHRTLDTWCVCVELGL